MTDETPTAETPAPGATQSLWTSTVTGPGMAAAIWAMSCSSTRAGTHCTARSIARPSGRLAPGRVGTTAPRATSRTAATATRPT